MKNSKKTRKAAFALFASIILAGCSLNPNNIMNQSDNSAKVMDSIWESTNSGKTWEARKKAENTVSLSGLEVVNMVINPYDAKNVYVGLRGKGILKTTDGGENWEYLKYEPSQVNGLDLDPTDSRIIYASGVWQKRGKMYKSRDAGENWEEIYTSADNGPLIMSLRVDKRDSQTVYASTSDNQVIKSTDAGGSWKNIFDAKTPILEIAIDHFDNKVVYLLGQNRRLFRSTNKGVSFDDITDKVRDSIANGNDVTVLVTDPTNAGSVYLAGKVGIIYSRNSGDSWQAIEPLNESRNSPVRSLAINPSNPNEMIYGAGQTIYRSVDGGKNWTTTQFSMSKFPSIIRYSALDPNMVYLGFDK